MRLNPVNGKAALGFSTNLSVDGVVPAPLVGIGAQLPRWYDAAGNVLVYVNVTTAQIQTINLGTLVITTVDTGEASRLGAGTSVWVRSRNLAGVDSSLATFVDQPLAGLADVDPSGSFALVQAFAADRGIVAYSVTGTELWRLDVPLSPAGIPRARNDTLSVCLAGGTWSLYTLSTGAAVPFAPRAVGVVETVPIVLADGSRWVLERTGDDTLTFRGATQSQGYVLSSTIVYNPDVMELTPGVVRIGWSATAGEAVTSLRMVDLTLGTGANTQWTTASGTLVSSVGTPISGLTGLATTAGAGGRELQALLRHPITEPNRLVTKEWQKWFHRRAYLDSQPIALGSETTGILPVAQGGTGGTTGTSVINATNVTLGTLPQNVKWTEATIALTGTQHNVAYNSADFLRAANAAALTVTGLVAGVPGQRLMVAATAGFAVTLSHQNAGSTAANRLLSFTGADVTLSQHQAALLEYDGEDDRWRLLLVSGAGSASASGGGAWLPTGEEGGGDPSWMVPPGGTGGSGSGGDVVGPAAAVDGNVAVFSGTTGKLIRDGGTPSAWVSGAGYWSALTDGDATQPELIFASGDTVSVWVPTP